MFASNSIVQYQKKLARHHKALRLDVWYSVPALSPQSDVHCREGFIAVSALLEL